MPQGADAALLDLCRQLDADSHELRHHDQLSAVGGPTLMDEHELDRVLGRAHDAIELIAALPATTADGIRAKAGALGAALLHCVAVQSDKDFDEQAENYERLAMSLVRDLVGGGPAMAARPSLAASESGASVMADIIPITSRRNALRFGAGATMAALLTPTIAAPAANPAPESEIFSLCRQFDALQLDKRIIFDTMEDGFERECAIDEVELLQEPMVERLAELRATTMDEHRARARSIAGYIGEDQLDEDAQSDCWHERLLAAALRDLAGLA